MGMQKGYRDMNFKIKISGDEGSLHLSFSYSCRDMGDARIRVGEILKYGIVTWNEEAKQFVGYPAHRIDIVHAFEIKDE